MNEPTPIYDQLVREQERQQCTPEPPRDATASDQGDPETGVSPPLPSERPS